MTIVNSKSQSGQTWSQKDIIMKCFYRTASFLALQTALYLPLYLSNWLTTRHFPFWHKRTILETSDPWDIWSEWWEDMTWPKNIARGTTDPEIDSVTWIELGNKIAPLTLVAYLATRWRHLHYLQIWPTDGAIYISCKFGLQMAPLA